MSEQSLRRPCSKDKYFVREDEGYLILENLEGTEIARREKTQTGKVTRMRLAMGYTDEIVETETPFSEMAIDDFVWIVTQDSDYLPV